MNEQTLRGDRSVRHVEGWLILLAALLRIGNIPLDFGVEDGRRSPVSVDVWNTGKHAALPSPECLLQGDLYPHWRASIGHPDHCDDVKTSYPGRKKTKQVRFVSGTVLRWITVGREMAWSVTVMYFFDPVYLKEAGDTLLERLKFFLIVY